MCVRLLLFVERFFVIESNIAGKLVVPGGGWGRPGVARGGRRHLVMYRGGLLWIVTDSAHNTCWRPEVAYSIWRRPVAAGGGRWRPVAACYDRRQPEAARNARQKYVFPQIFMFELVSRRQHEERT